MKQKIKILVGIPDSEKKTISIQGKDYFLRKSKSAFDKIGFEFTIINGINPQVLVDSRITALFRANSYDVNMDDISLVQENDVLGLNLKGPFLNKDNVFIQKFINAWVLYVVLHVTQGIPFPSFSSIDEYYNDAHKIYKDLCIFFKKTIQ